MQIIIYYLIDYWNKLILMEQVIHGASGFSDFFFRTLLQIWRK